jgi:hypothetical protein
MPADEAAATSGKTAVTTDEAASPVGIAALPVGAAAFPVGIAALPVGAAAFPVGIAALPVGTAAFPVGIAALPVGAAAFPVGIAASPVITASSALLRAAFPELSSSRMVRGGASSRLASFFIATRSKPKNVAHTKRRNVLSANQNAVLKPVAELKLPKNVPALVTYAQGVEKALTGNASIPNPVPSVAALTAAIGDLAAAQTATQTRVKGAVATRNEKKAALLTLLRQLRGNVQALADASPDNAGSLIESAGLTQRKSAARDPRIFAAKPAGVTGSVTLVAPAAARRASYEWEYSSDGGTTWTAAAPTLQARTVVPALKAGTTIAFRYRPIVKGGAANWSQVVSLLVQ